MEMRPHHKYFISAIAASIFVIILVIIQLIGSNNIQVRIALVEEVPGSICDEFRYGETCYEKEETEKLHKLHQERTDYVKRVCERKGIQPSQDYVPTHKIEYLYVDDKHKLLYCSVPKVACTNWKRLLLVLSNKTNYTQPLQIPAGLVHSEEMDKHVRTLDTYTQSEIQYRLKNYFKFVVVRDPLERILSAYRNKFTLPYNTYFHERYGRRIIKKYRKKPSKVSIEGGHDVKFNEFIQYLLDPNSPKPFNEHWRPIYKLCFPCINEFDVIGKYETLDQDVDYILKRSGIYNKVSFPMRGSSRPRTSDLVRAAYRNISSETIHRLWELYSIDYAMFNYPYPDFISQ